MTLVSATSSIIVSNRLDSRVIQVKLWGMEAMVAIEVTMAAILNGKISNGHEQVRLTGVANRIREAPLRASRPR